MLPGFAETLVANMGDAVIFADRDRIIRYWNGGASRLFGYMADSAVGQSLDLIIPERLRTRHWLGYNETMRTAKTRYGERHVLSVPAVRKDGTQVSVAFTILPFADSAGSLTGIAAVMRDVTAQFEEVRALRRQLAAAQIKHQDEPPTGAAHTPVGSIEQREAAPNGQVR